VPNERIGQGRGAERPDEPEGYTPSDGESLEGERRAKRLNLQGVEEEPSVLDLHDSR
jgi:hypothetical protein